MGVKLVSSSGGSVELVAPTTASNFTHTVPAQTGTVLLKESTSGMSVPAFSAYQATTIALSGSTFTKVPANTEDWDTASCYDNTNYRFTPNVAGYYSICGSARVNGATSLQRVIVVVYKNGAEWARLGDPTFTTSSMGPTVQFGGATMVYLNGSTDYVELYVYVIGTGSLTLVNDGNRSYSSSFQGALVRAA